VLLSSCTGHWKRANVSSSLAQGRATLLSPKNLCRGRDEAALSPHRSPCSNSHPALMICGWCCVPYIPHSCLPCGPSTFRVLLCPKIGQYQCQAHFLKSAFSQTSLLQRNPAENFTLSHSLIFQLVGSYCL